MDSETQAKVWAAATGYEVAEGSYWLPDDEDDEFRAIPDLTTGDGMLRLLDAMQAKGWQWRLESAEHNGVRDPDSEHPVPWHDPALEGTPLCTAMFTQERGEDVWLELPNYAEAPTLPLAVARAAAAALGVEGGG
jgi:hypothetical protein